MAGTIKSFLIAVGVAVLLASDAWSQQVELSFPLGEHYRPGRYLPARVDANNITGPTLRIEAAGAVPTEITTSDGRVSVVVPLLPVTTLKDARWSDSSSSSAIQQPLRPLGADERLVGATTTGADVDALAAELFPNAKPIIVALNLANPLPGPAVAWGALDAVLLDPAAAARVTDKQLATLLAAGTTVGIRSAAKPGGDWPWEPEGPWWIVRADLRGPDGLIEPLAYEPVAAWNPGWPASSRRSLVLSLVAFAIVAVALTLWRSRYATLAVGVAAVVATGGLVAWRAHAYATRTVTGAVWVQHAAATQFDFWSYHRALADGGRESEHVLDVTRPVFASRRHFEDAGLTLDAGDGSVRMTPVFRYPSLRGRTIAFLHRRFDARVPVPVPSDGSDSPLRRLAERVYLERDDRLLAVAMLRLPHDPPDHYELWPTVLIGPRGSSPFPPTRPPATKAF